MKSFFFGDDLVAALGEGVSDDRRKERDAAKVALKSRTLSSCNLAHNFLNWAHPRRRLFGKWGHHGAKWQ